MLRAWCTRSEICYSFSFADQLTLIVIIVAVTALTLSVAAIVSTYLAFLGFFFFCFLVPSAQKCEMLSLHSVDKCFAVKPFTCSTGIHEVLVCLLKKPLIPRQIETFSLALP